MKFSAILKLIAALSLFVIAGCATYGWTDAAQADSDDAGHSLRVDTLAAPAHLGLDHSRLRAHLIDELQRSGVTVVHTDDAPRLRCSVIEHRTSGFERDLFAEMNVSCDILVSATTTPVATLAVRGFSSEPGSDSRVMFNDISHAESQAVVDAFTRLSPQVADKLEETYFEP